MITHPTGIRDSTCSNPFGKNLKGGEVCDYTAEEGGNGDCFSGHCNCSGVHRSGGACRCDFKDNKDKGIKKQIQEIYKADKIPANKPCPNGGDFCKKWCQYGNYICDTIDKNGGLCKCDVHHEHKILGNKGGPLGGGVLPATGRFFKHLFR